MGETAPPPQPTPHTVITLSATAQRGGARGGSPNTTGNGAMPAFSAVSAPKQHVLINLGDALGSTAIVLDQATSELVESTTYLAHGATESDYRPSRWQGLREDYKFTGKEEDVEVGLQYFGKRFLSPYLNRWVSPDPLAVHVLGGDANLYAYVTGQLLQSVDPVGLKDEPSSAPDSYNEQNERRENPLTPDQVQKAWQMDQANKHRAAPKPAATGNGSSQDGAGTSRTPRGPDGVPGAQGTNPKGTCTGSDCGGGGKMPGYSSGDQVTIGVAFVTGNPSADKNGVSGGIPGGIGPDENAGTGMQALWGAAVLFGNKLIDKGVGLLAKAEQKAADFAEKAGEWVEKKLAPTTDVSRRPSTFRKGTVQEAWDSAANGPTGGKTCPTCGKEVKVEPGQGTRASPRDWDVDHQPPWSTRDQIGKTRQQVLDDYNTGTRLECPTCNRSRGAKPAQ